MEAGGTTLLNSTHFMPGLLWMRSCCCNVLSPCRTCLCGRHPPPVTLSTLPLLQLAVAQHSGLDREAEPRKRIAGVTDAPRCSGCAACTAAAGTLAPPANTPTASSTALLRDEVRAGDWDSRGRSGAKATYLRIQRQCSHAGAHHRRGEQKRPSSRADGQSCFVICLRVLVPSMTMRGYPHDLRRFPPRPSAASSGSGWPRNPMAARERAALNMSDR